MKARRADPFVFRQHPGPSRFFAREGIQIYTPQVDRILTESKWRVDTRFGMCNIQWEIHLLCASCAQFSLVGWTGIAIPFSLQDEVPALRGKITNNMKYGGR